MKTGLVITSIIVSFAFSACTIFRGYYKPSEFTYQYNGKYTEIDSLININGYYIELNQNRPSLMFYKDGLICRTFANPLEQFRDNLDKSYNTWGTYSINKDTIKCQFVSDDGLMVGVSVYKSIYIIKDKNIIVEFISKDIQNQYSFHPLENRIDSTNWLLKKKWFWKEGYYPKNRLE